MPFLSCFCSWKILKGGISANYKTKINLYGPWLNFLQYVWRRKQEEASSTVCHLAEDGAPDGGGKAGPGCAH